ncbi:hypothetical protein JM84_2437 [Dokdonia sp. Hel_I_63]|uniref:hypothetical protein n=1 Tax=Dokdonia sp. Hel_I_63 TaxID=1249996 RepID=UPI00119BC04D|nr:hypothetical protein [Dokdonia sp. Hel_I_63]TVZ23509.1 hypothetical protein JM84_2437 [Dokdonia sp. Hel_I_63]
MTDKEIIKYIDLLINDIDDFDTFSVNNIIFEYINPESKEEEESFLNKIDEIKLFGKNNDLFVPITKDGWCKLTEKGKKLKLSKKSFKKFQKLEKKSEWYNNNWVGYLIAFIVFLFTVYQHFDNQSLSRENKILNTQYDSLKIELDFFKDSISNFKSVNFDETPSKKIDSLAKK